MKLFFIIGGLFIIIFICIIPLSRDIKEYNIQKNGDLVIATITYIPDCVGAKIMYFMKFTYAGKEFDKKVGCGFADTHKIGDTIQLRHIDGSDIFLYVILFDVSAQWNDANKNDYEKSANNKK